MQGAAGADGGTGTRGGDSRGRWAGRWPTIFLARREQIVIVPIDDERGNGRLHVVVDSRFEAI